MAASYYHDPGQLVWVENNYSITTTATLPKIGVDLGAPPATEECDDDLCVACGTGEGHPVPQTWWVTTTPTVSTAGNGAWVEYPVISKEELKKLYSTYMSIQPGKLAVVSPENL